MICSHSDQINSQHNHLDKYEERGEIKQRGTVVNFKTYFKAHMLVLISHIRRELGQRSQLLETI